MLYLFVASIVPTVPAGWLTFAEGSIYDAYDIPQRMGGISVTSDQQAAGAIMKLVGGSYLWVIITLRFFQWAAKFSDTDKAVDQAGPAHDLKWPDIEREFDSHPAPPEPAPQRHRPGGP
jgi:putative membrane protein